MRCPPKRVHDPRTRGLRQSTTIQAQKTTVALALQQHVLPFRGVQEGRSNAVLRALWGRFPGKWNSWHLMVNKSTQGGSNATMNNATALWYRLSGFPDSEMIVVCFCAAGASWSVVSRNLLRWAFPMGFCHEENALCDFGAGKRRIR